MAIDILLAHAQSFLPEQSGIAAYGNAPSASIPAAFLITTIDSIAAYKFSLLGRLCAITGASSYRGAWEASVGEATAWIPGSSCDIKTFLAVLAYSMVLGDAFLGLGIGRPQTLRS